MPRPNQTLVANKATKHSEAQMPTLIHKPLEFKYAASAAHMKALTKAAGNPAWKIAAPPLPPFAPVALALSMAACAPAAMLRPPTTNHMACWKNKLIHALADSNWPRSSGTARRHPPTTTRGRLAVTAAASAPPAPRRSAAMDAASARG